jgi:hypothetical protein
MVCISYVTEKKCKYNNHKKCVSVFLNRNWEINFVIQQNIKLLLKYTTKQCNELTVVVWYEAYQGSGLLQTWAISFEN